MTEVDAWVESLAIHYLLLVCIRAGHDDSAYYLTGLLCRRALLAYALSADS